MAERQLEMLPDAEHFLKLEHDFKVLCRNVLGTGQGLDLMKQLKRVYCEGKLFQNSDRDTVYCLAQRDLIMELIHNSKGELL